MGRQSMAAASAVVAVMMVAVTGARLIEWQATHSLPHSARALRHGERHAVPHIKRCSIASRNTKALREARQRKRADGTCAGHDRSVTVGQRSAVALSQRRVGREAAANSD